MKKVISKDKKHNVKTYLQDFSLPSYPRCTFTVEERLNEPFTKKKMVQARETIERCGLPDRSLFKRVL
jgi:hypothetical protein